MFILQKCLSSTFIYDYLAKKKIFGFRHFGEVNEFESQQMMMMIIMVTMAVMKMTT